jgi:hypothetical protein
MFKILSLVLIIVGSLIAQEVNYDAYDDSVKAANIKDSINDSIAKVELEKINNQPEEICELNSNDSLVLDSLEQLIIILDKQWNSSKRLRGNESVKDRIDAINFYLSKKVIDKNEADKFINIVYSQKKYELEGTKYLIQKQCGHNRIVANAHLRKIEKELVTIESYLFNLNNVQIKIAIN